MSTTEPKPALYALTPEAHATVLAALCFYQSNLDAYGDLPEGINDIASNSGTLQPLDADDISALAESLNNPGLEFGEIVNLIGDDDSDPYVAAALQHGLLHEGTLEVDGKTIVSRGDDPGAYVMAWLWIDNAFAGLADEEEDDDDDDGYRAAYWTDGQSSVRLTGEEQQHLPDDELLAAARREADDNRLEIGDGQIVIGRWVD